MRAGFNKNGKRQVLLSSDCHHTARNTEKRRYAREDNATRRRKERGFVPTFVLYFSKKTINLDLRISKTNGTSIFIAASFSIN
mgnify:CR=1 FL=1